MGKLKKIIERYLKLFFQQIIIKLKKWGRSSVWLERLPVTQEVASSSLVVPAIIKKIIYGFHKNQRKLVLFFVIYFYYKETGHLRSPKGTFRVQGNRTFDIREFNKNLVQGNSTFDIRKINKNLDKQAITACFLVQRFAS